MLKNCAARHATRRCTCTIECDGALSLRGTRCNIQSCTCFSIFEAAGSLDGVGPRGSTRAPLCVRRWASGERLWQQRAQDVERGRRGAPRSTRDAGRRVPPARARSSGVDKHRGSTAGARGVDGTAAQGHDDCAPKWGGRAARSHLEILKDADLHGRELRT